MEEERMEIVSWGPVDYPPHPAWTVQSVTPVESSVDDLVAWLRAQLDEDERVARAAKNHTGQWRWDHGFGEMCNDPTCPFGELIDETESGDKLAGTVLMQVHGYDIREPWEGAEHIARHDPARVLREVESKRRILDECVYGLQHQGIYGEDGQGPMAEEILPLLALPYADRPGYQESWRP